MRGSQSSLKSYGAISPRVGDNFKNIGKTLISDTHGKIGLSARSTGDLGSGGGGEAPVSEPNRCLISCQCSGVTVSTTRPNEVTYLARIYLNIHEELDELTRVNSGLNLEMFQIRNTLSTKYLSKWWEKIMEPTGNVLYVYYIEDIDVPRTSLAYVEGLQTQIDAIHNKEYGARSPWVTTDFDQLGNTHFWPNW